MPDFSSLTTNDWVSIASAIAVGLLLLGSSPVKVFAGKLLAKVRKVAIPATVNLTETNLVQVMENLEALREKLLREINERETQLHQIDKMLGVKQ